MIRVVPILLAALLAVAALSLSYGDYAVSLAEMARVLTGSADASPQAEMIVIEFRLPRVLTAILVGIALAIAGAITQALMRNPLAEPGIIGINSGAALAGVFVIVYMENSVLHLLPWLSFLGALAMTVAIYILAWREGTSSIRIILVGIGLNALAGGGGTLVSTLGDVDAMQQAMVWLSGSVYASSWETLTMITVWLAPALLLTFAATRELDLIGSGDDVSRSLGQRVNLVRGALMVLCAVISGAAVAAASLIGFIGLVAPHLARSMVGHTHAKLLPVAALIGGLLLLCADFLARLIIAPAQLFTGLMTAILGAPFFFYLLRKRQNA